MRQARHVLSGGSMQPAPNQFDRDESLRAAQLSPSGAKDAGSEAIAEFG